MVEIISKFKEQGKNSYIYTYTNTTQTHTFGRNGPFRDDTYRRRTVVSRDPTIVLRGGTRHTFTRNKHKTLGRVVNERTISKRV